MSIVFNNSLNLSKTKITITFYTCSVALKILQNEFINTSGANCEILLALF